MEHDGGSAAIKNMTIAMDNRITVEGRKIWVRCAGSTGAARTPIVVVSGGPGMGCKYLEPLEYLCSTGRQVIFYDPLGVGRSDPMDTHMYSFATAVEELRELFDALGVSQAHVLGHSIGGAVALAYAAEAPDRASSVIAYSPVIDFTHWETEQRRLREAMDPQQFDSEQSFLEAYYRKYWCRANPWPACLVSTVDDLFADPRVFYAMYGPDHFEVTGSLRGFSALDAVARVAAPVLLLGGAHDYATPQMLSRIERRLANVQRVEFAESSHTAHLEEPAAFRAAVEAFLSGRD
jgi:proline-specific peptidase